MASVMLQNIKKVYPNAEEGKRAHRKADTRGRTAKQEAFPAVRDFDLEIADKEFVVLVGPSGCGKSTVLRMIAGLEEISGGELYIGGRKMNETAPKERDIAMVFQNYALYPHMTVYDNMAFALKLQKTDREMIDKRVREAAEILEITKYLNRKPKALSGGQRQRVAIGRAIVREPKAILMDEPLSNLDAKLRNQMRTEIMKLRRRIHTTFLYVTHDQAEAMTLGDRIVIMKDGRIQQVGTPREVFERPSNLFVAGFIGTPQMNFFEGVRLRRERNRFVAEIGGMQFCLPEPFRQRLEEKEVSEGTVTAGVRPAYVRLAEDGLEGTVEVWEMMGSEVHLHMAVAGGEVTAVLPTIGLPVECLTAGSRVHVTMEPSLIHLFDPETGENLLK